MVAADEQPVLRGDGPEPSRSSWRDDVGVDVRYALRTLGRSPGFTLVTITTLALGIGVNVLIFSVINAVLLHPVPYEHPERLVRIVENYPPPEGSRDAPRRVSSMEPGELAQLASATRTLSHVAGYGPAPTLTIVGREESLRLRGAMVSVAALPMLGATPLLGRMFESSDETVGHEAVVVLSHVAWQRYFDADRNVLGTLLTIEGRAYTVVGVASAGFEFPDRDTRFWIPIAPDAPRRAGAIRRVSTLARLQEGVSLETATGEVTRVLNELRGNPPEMNTQVSGPPQFELVRFQDELVAPVRPSLLMIAGAAGVILLIACVNVANMLLARTAAREREIAVRRALGAGARRLFRQFLTESMVLALLGGAVGIAVAYVGLQVVQLLGGGLPRRDLGPGVSIPRLSEVGIDPSALLFTVGLSLVTGLLFGLSPALRRSQAQDVNSLREGAGSAASGFSIAHGSRLRGLLVVSEVAMAMVLLVAGGLLIRGFTNLSQVRTGYDSSNVLTFQVSWPAGRLSQEEINRSSEDLVAQLQKVPALQSVGYAQFLPMVQLRSGMPVSLGVGPSMSGPVVAGGPPPPPGPPGRPGAPAPPGAPGGAPANMSPESATNVQRVSRQFLTVMGVRVLAGRGLGENDGEGQPLVMLINRAMAQREFAGVDPLGKLVYAGRNGPFQIIGVVDDIRQFGLDQEPIPQFFIDTRQLPGLPSPDGSGPYFAIRSSKDPASLAPDVRRIVREFDPHATVDNFATMEQIVANSVSRQRLYTALLGLFAFLALTLAIVGIYGVMSYSVSQRTRELGIRVALGAQRTDVMTLVLGQSLRTTAVGIALGLGGAMSVTRLLEGMLYGVTPLDVPTFVVASVVFVAVAALAAYVPARRAMKLDPLVALRTD